MTLDKYIKAVYPLINDIDINLNTEWGRTEHASYRVYIMGLWEKLTVLYWNILYNPLVFIIYILCTEHTVP